MSGGFALYVPERRRGKGSGHLRRTLELLRIANGSGRLYLPEAAENDAHTRLQALVNAGAQVGELEEERFLGKPEEVTALIESGRLERVVFDQQELPAEEFDRFRDAPLTVGIDTGGPGARFLDIAFEALPRLPQDSNANRESLGYLFLPEQRRDEWPSKVNRILVTLGGEDAGAAAESLARGLSQLMPELELFYTRDGRIHGPEGVLPEPHAPLRENLHLFDLVVLHYGITLFEALYARVPVITLPVTDYHHALAEALDLDSCDSLDLDVIAPEVARIVIEPRDAVERGRRAAPEETLNLGEELKALEIPSYRNPLHPKGPEPDPVVARYPDRSYYRCARSGLLYMRRFTPSTISYNERYFFEEYQKQYGKTYLEDFEQIRRMGRSRLKKIRRLRRRRRPGSPDGRPDGMSPSDQPERPRKKGARGDTPKLLDIGCAYGPFLAAAEDAGYQVHGIDVASEAVAYVKETLGFPAVQARVEELDPVATFGVDRFDVITLWYVIEHLPNLHEVLPAIHALLAPGGILAFSTPNGEGISATSERDRFLQSSPEDHVTIWEPSRVGEVLAPFGFDVAALRITGHHPERFPILQATGNRLKKKLFTPFLRTMSTVRGLGDTFECYAQRR